MSIIRARKDFIGSVLQQLNEPSAARSFVIPESIQQSPEEWEKSFGRKIVLDGNQLSFPPRYIQDGVHGEETPWIYGHA